MPRKSQRKFLIEWFLEGIEKDKYHLQAESFQSFTGMGGEGCKTGAQGSEVCTFLGCGCGSAYLTPHDINPRVSR
ncbi:hypothetical protein L211DRAFT_486997 [Terfezia boudieri ATCC MYA-4762]|uniref:Uncharacterized protein n=1 Tax=Terfezia boudieri ATCC MYA-4762 TaxID=1051890 RepID=A0A3N4LZ75_9PEZI|nr:hypothetical protein L211DRAFT_486997 [Terfezia boudieri ATCC MYA-4762]